MSAALWAAATASCLLLAAMWLSLCQMPASEKEPVSDVNQAAAVPYRILGVWNGKVAVFLPDIAEPERVYDTPLLSLPTAEQERLQSGIPVENRQQLRRLLEDYGS